MDQLTIVSQPVSDKVLWYLPPEGFNKLNESVVERTTTVPKLMFEHERENFTGVNILRCSNTLTKVKRLLTRLTKLDLI